MAKRILPSIGTVTKKETLISAEHVDGVSILVFETEHPYYGYYGTTVPSRPDTASYFLVTKHLHNDNNIIRAIQGVKRHFTHSFDGVPGHVSYSNKQYGIIRIRCMAERHLPELIEAFQKEGIVFMAKQKQSPKEALIRITKYFETEEVEDGIYLDLINPSFAYLQIDKYLRWNTFESLTKHVKNNVGALTFDAAITSLYDANGVIDLVRVYDDKRSVDKLRIIRQRYLDSL